MSKKYTLYALFLLVFTITFSLFLINVPNYNNYIFLGDQASYFKTASLFYNNFEAHVFRTFGYPLLLGLPELLGFIPPYGYWPIILNIIFFAGILWVFLKFQEELKIKLALLTAVALSLCFGFIYGMSLALTETGFSFFIVLAIFKLYQYLKYHKAAYVFYFFLYLGIATLFRPGLYLVTLGIVPFFIIYQLIFNRFTLLTSFFIISGLMLTLGFQSILMKRTFNTYRLSYIDDITWYRYCGALSTTIHNQNCFSSECFKEEQANRDRIIENLSDDEMSAISKDDRKDILFNKTAAFIKAMKVVISSDLLSGCVKQEENKFIYYWTIINNLILSILPFLMYAVFLIFPALRKRLPYNLHIILAFILLIIFYTVVTSAISAQQGDRFHIVFYPLSLLLIAILTYKLRTKQVE